MSDYTFWYNENMNKLTKLAVLLVALGIIGYAYFVWRQRVVEINNTNTTTEELSETMVTDQKNQLDQANQVDQADQADGMGGASNEDTAAIVSTILNRVKFNAGNLYEAQVVNIVNDFEQAYNKKNQTLVVALFDKSANITGLPNSVWGEDASYPISFKFESVEVRGDTSALVTVDESFYNPQTKTKQTRRRLLELYPVNSSYVIGKYFTPNLDTPLAGFTN